MDRLKCSLKEWDVVGATPPGKTLFRIGSDKNGKVRFFRTRDKELLAALLSNAGASGVTRDASLLVDLANLQIADCFAPRAGLNYLMSEARAAHFLCNFFVALYKLIAVAPPAEVVVEQFIVHVLDAKLEVNRGRLEVDNAVSSLNQYPPQISALQELLFNSLKASSRLKKSNDSVLRQLMALIHSGKQ